MFDTVRNVSIHRVVRLLAPALTSTKLGRHHIKPVVPADVTTPASPASPAFPAFTPPTSPLIRDGRRRGGAVSGVEAAAAS